MRENCGLSGKEGLKEFYSGFWILATDFWILTKELSWKSMD